MNLNPILTSILVFVWGVGSLLIVAIKTNSVKTVFLRKPSIIIGDFLILPVISGLIVYTYQISGKTIAEIFSPFTVSLITAVSLILTVISAVRNRLLSRWWLFHGLFYWLIAFWILYFLIRNFNLQSLAWWSVLIGIFTHQFLGIIFPKKFPVLKG